MTDEEIVIKDVSDKLISENIEFMITGSIALNQYSVPRMTRDIDIVINLKEDDSEKIVRLFSEDYYIPVPTLKESIRRKTLVNIVHNELIVKVDFVIKKNTPFRNLEFSRRQKVNLGFAESYIATIEDLIISKLLWAKESESDFQLRDVSNLVQFCQFDKNYVNEWSDKLEIKNLLERCLNE